jgi:hypothetical protein
VHKQIFIGILLLVIMTSSSTAQIQPNTDCVSAKTWHLQQAMKITLQSQQEYHILAAQAAGELSTMGGAPCVGWKDWAAGRTGPSEP